MNQFDVTLYHMINGMAGHNPLLDAVMAFFAQYALELYAVLFILAWFVLPKQDVKNRHMLVISFCSGVLALLINVVISHVWYRPRPFTVLPKDSFTQLIPHSYDASFPSDHTSGSFGFAAASWGTEHKWISYSFTAIAVLVMFARVYCGVHYPTDVLAGFVVGTFSGRFMWRFSHIIYPLSVRIIKMFRFGPEDLTFK